MKGNVRNEITSQRMVYGSTEQPTLAIVYSLSPNPGDGFPSSQPDGATIQIDNDGGTGSTLRVILKTKTKTSAGVASTTTTNNIDGADYSTLKEFIDAINALTGFTAWALHAPQSMDMDVDTFEDVAETDIPCDIGKPRKTLYRTAAAGTPVYMRIGLPEPRDGGRVRIVNFRGTSTDVTNGTVKIYRDDPNEYTATPVPLFQKVLAEAETAYITQDKLDAHDYRGPLIVEVNSDDLSASDHTVAFMAGSY